jgi:hypothetical protein
LLKYKINYFNVTLSKFLRMVKHNFKK